MILAESINNPYEKHQRLFKKITAILEKTVKSEGLAAPAKARYAERFHTLWETKIGHRQR